MDGTESMITVPYLLLQTILLPLFAAGISFVVGGRLGKNVGWFIFAVLLYTTILLFIAGYGIYTTGQPYPQENYNWAGSAGLSFGFLADNLSLPVALVMNIIVTVSAVYSMPYMKHRLEAMYGEERKDQYGLYYLNYTLFAVGLVGVALSTNLIELYLFVELALIPSFLLIGFFGYIDRERIAMMYFIWNQLGALIFIAGGLLAYFTDGNSFAISALSNIGTSYIAYWVVFLILVGWLVKMATFIFHVWLPWAHGEHPTSIAAIIAIIVGLGNYVIVRVLVTYMFPAFQFFGLPLMILALITMVYGGIITMMQNDVKRVYAWSTISQTAYSLLGIGSLTALGISGGVFYFISHMIGKCILFSAAGILLSQTGTRDMRKMGGLASKMPITAVITLCGSLILSAVPPFSGFQAEWIMFVGIFQQGVAPVSFNVIIAIVGIIATMFTVAYTFWPVKKIFFGQLPHTLEKVKEAPLTMTIPLLVLVAIALLIGIYPQFVLKFLSAYIAGPLHFLK